MRILITGAAAGLAQGIALALARDGHEIAFTFRPDGTPPDRTLELLRTEGYDAAAFPVEFFGEESAVAAAVERALRPAPEAVVHAVGPMTIRRFERSSSQDYAEMIDGNLRSAVIVSRAALPAMREAGFGRLIFFGFNGSHETKPIRGLSLHGAAKAGLVAFARTLALEEAKHGITTNVIEPGDIRDKTLTRAKAATLSADNPRGRPGTWEDIADAVRFLLDPDLDFVNGAVIPITGGALG